MSGATIVTGKTDAIVHRLLMPICAAGQTCWWM